MGMSEGIKLEAHTRGLYLTSMNRRSKQVMVGLIEASFLPTTSPKDRQRIDRIETCPEEV